VKDLLNGEKNGKKFGMKLNIVVKSAEEIGSNQNENK
jgi:hypothetical protein|tara:strand:- start:309 stop:419 length:111 start_codon:yes stop_codon:yes gene_type:complete